MVIRVMLSPPPLPLTRVVENTPTGGSGEPAARGAPGAPRMAGSLSAAAQVMVLWDLAGALIGRLVVALSLALLALMPHLLLAQRANLLTEDSDMRVNGERLQCTIGGCSRYVQQ